jgi:ATP phosphoribosyltransferase
MVAKSTEASKQSQGQPATAEKQADTGLLKITLPTGRIQEKVLKLLEQIGVTFQATNRSYRPTCSDPALQAKFLKAQNIPGLVALGRHDCGFTGFDWITEQEADVVEILDLEFDPVQIVVAVPEHLVEIVEKNGRDCERQLIIASEYRKLTADYIKRKGLNAVFVQAFGATEALPPEDADIIIDNTATGTTLRANRLVIIETIMRSTTRFICNKQAYEDPAKRQKLEEMKMLMKSSVQAKSKVLLEMNVSNENFQQVVSAVPCMRAPTVMQLHNGDGYAIKIAVPVKDVPQLIPKLVALGATDILEYRLEKIVG